MPSRSRSSATRPTPTATSTSTTGRVITITTGDPEAALNRQQVSENIRNFLRVEPASSREQYRWMEKFVGSVVDEPLRERLIISIDGKGAFRRFKDVLLAYPAERERWFSVSRRAAALAHPELARAARDRRRPTSRRGAQVEAPTELPAVGRPVVHGTEAPGEALRRQARELIETIPAIELPTAIAFLEFLKQRSAERSPRTTRTIATIAIYDAHDDVTDATPSRSSRSITQLVQHAPGRSTPRRSTSCATRSSASARRSRCAISRIVELVGEQLVDPGIALPALAEACATLVAGTRGEVDALCSRPRAFTSTR